MTHETPFCYCAVVRLVATVFLLAPATLSAQETPSASPLRVRLGTLSRHELTVLGMEDGLLRLRPSDSDTGEILVRLEDARDLQFQLPPAYREAQQLAFHHRAAEALTLLRPVVEPMVPFLAAPETNAVVAVQTYFELLVAQEQWVTARALVEQLPPNLLNSSFAERLLQLAALLRRVQEPEAAVRVVLRLSPEQRPALVPAVDRFAHALRRDGYWSEAQRVYERLQPFDPPDARRHRSLLIGYVQWHQGAKEFTRAAVAGWEDLGLESQSLALHRLLLGRVLLESGAAGEALDAFAHGLVHAEGSSEWRVELQSALAEAYRGAGRTPVAAAIEQDLRRLHPQSRWTPPAADGRPAAEAGPS